MVACRATITRNPAASVTASPIAAALTAKQKLENSHIARHSAATLCVAELCA